MSIYKACDIRGTFGTELTVRHARRLGQAVMALQKPAQAVVGGDGRESTPRLKGALIEALMQGGCRVVDIGIVPTPAFYYARRSLGIETGIQVTASHNPPGDNGFKLILGAMPVTEAEIQALAGWIEGGAAGDREAGVGPGVSVREDILVPYLESLKPFIPDLAGMKVVVDCANGMAGLGARAVWSQTGARVRYLLEEVDGRYPAHPPNPSVAANLALLREAVLAERADIGVAYDGDADRVTFVDEAGCPVPTDKVIVTFAQLALAGGPQTVVYDQKCSQVVPDAVRAAGGRPVMERSGHTFIKTAFLELEAVYAGEISGHHFFREIGEDDGLAASLIYARYLYGSREPLSKLVAAIPSYPITPDIRLPMPAPEIERLMLELEDNLSGEAEVRKTDGIRLAFADGWALVRPSVTEPVVSLRFEGVDAASLERIVARVTAATGLLRRAQIPLGAGDSGCGW